ncbi:hypothetical protein GCM10022220_72870 [Actinocatenispora rupis]|uniref:Uncharacterized protein n=1 Tax=Actinocatenispora rupis TaxID=519421 RepID=A0A8J3J9H0_9ACTN|nr:hypothetical protein Aru02nite_72620 [Actinocatenispora rupis]
MTVRPGAAAGGRNPASARTSADPTPSAPPHHPPAPRHNETSWRIRYAATIQCCTAVGFRCVTAVWPADTAETRVSRLSRAGSTDRPRSDLAGVTDLLRPHTGSFRALQQ